MKIEYLEVKKVTSKNCWIRRSGEGDGTVILQMPTYAQPISIDASLLQELIDLFKAYLFEEVEDDR